jgi:hypothetical protein
MSYPVFLFWREGKISKKVAGAMLKTESRLQEYGTKLKFK